MSAVGRPRYTMTDIAATIDIPLENWPGKCWAIATECVAHDIVKGTVEYGMFQGEIAATSFFRGRPLSRHGWVRLPDGQVWDPTRWVFEDVDPYIYIGSDYDYDFGATQLNQAITGRVPADESQILEYLDNPDTFEDDREIVDMLAHTPPSAAPDLMGEVYETLERQGHGALIPIDYQIWAEGGAT